jgi:hypothetical protein
MAKQKLCAVAACGKPFYCKGYCTSHYQRFMKYGDPTGHHVSPLRPFVEKAVSYTGDECLIWPFGKTKAGYGMLRINGVNVTAHSAVCRLANGDPAHGQEVRHLCGVRACVAPRHLVWGTRKENMNDKAGHGTAPRGDSNGHAKLTEADVRWIREFGATLPRKEVAERFGVSPQLIGKVVLGRVWNWLK